MSKFIYADMVNGCRLIQQEDIEISIDKCDNMEDVRAYLRDMGDEEGDAFERVLEVPDALVEQVDEEYGIH